MLGLHSFLRHVFYFDTYNQNRVGENSNQILYNGITQCKLICNIEI